MKKIWTLLAIILVLIYVISPIDGIPDVIPVLGYIDDALIVWLLIFYLRYRRLPGFLSGIGKFVFGNMSHNDYDRGEKFDTYDSSNGAHDHQEGKEKDPYSILGVSKTATEAEIQKAYRDAVQKYHPDKVSHLGSDLQELAKQKFIEIQNAYDQLKVQKR